MRKLKWIYSLITLVVILSLFLVNSVPVSAAETTETVTYMAEDLYDLLFYFGFTITAYDPDTGEKFEVNRNDYQLIYAVGLEDVYCVVNFPDISVCQGYDLTLEFYNSMGMNVHSFKETILYRIPGGNNGDCHLLSTLKFTSNGASFYKDYEGSADGWEWYPYYNGYTDPDTGFYYINEEDPFSSTTTDKWYRQESLWSYVDYTAGSSSTSAAMLDSLSVYVSQDYYQSGSIVLYFKPITVTTVPSEIDRVENALQDLKDSLINMTPEQEQQNAAVKDAMDTASNALNNAMDSLKDSSSSLDNIYKPDVDVTGGFEMDSSLSEGLDTLAVGFSPFYENKYVLLIMASVVPIFIVSYLLFGKKV